MIDDRIANIILEELGRVRSQIEADAREFRAELKEIRAAQELTRLRHASLAQRVRTASAGVAVFFTLIVQAVWAWIER